MNKENKKIAVVNIKNMIFTYRNLQVMVDRDLAQLYGVTTKVLNQAVKRNIERFPDEFRFRLTDTEKNELVTNCDRFARLKHSSVNPYVFTEQGVAMLSAVLRSDTAVKVSIQIIKAFVEMKKFISTNAAIFQRLENVELKQIKTDKKIDKIFKALENKNIKPKQGIFYEGQIFDAYEFVSNLIKSAKKTITLLDNYIDDAEIFHFGASLKDLGKKWFAFSKFDIKALEILRKLD